MTEQPHPLKQEQDDVEAGDPRVLNWLLLQAVEARKVDIDKVITLLSQRADVNARYDDDERQDNSLLIAVKARNAKLVQVLLDAKANTHVTGRQGEYPLAMASFYGHEEIVGMLLRAGADPNEKAEDKDRHSEGYFKAWTPLTMAAQRGHHAIVKLLMDSKANLELTATEGLKECTALMVAARNGELEVVKMLLAAGADINAVGSARKTETHLPIFTALSYAIKNGHMAVVDELLLAKADINQANTFESTPLVLAVEKGLSDLVLRLILAKAKLNHNNMDSGNIALQHAVRNRDIVTAGYLTEAKANINEYSEKETPALYSWVVKEDASFVQILLGMRAEVDQCTSLGDTPLHRASRVGNIELVRILLDAKADPQIRNKAGRTALHWLAEGRERGGEVAESVEVLQRLLQTPQLKDSKAPLDVQDEKGDTALHIACRNGNFSVVAALLRARANTTVLNEAKQTPLNAQNVIGNTALHIACIRGNFDVVKGLLRASANITVLNAENLTPFASASEQNIPRLTNLWEKMKSLTVASGFGDFRVARSSSLYRLQRSSLFDYQVLRDPLTLAGLGATLRTVARPPVLAGVDEAELEQPTQLQPEL